LTPFIGPPDIDNGDPAARANRGAWSGDTTVCDRAAGAKISRTANSKGVRERYRVVIIVAF